MIDSVRSILSSVNSLLRSAIRLPCQPEGLNPGGEGLWFLDEFLSCGTPIGKRETKKEEVKIPNPSFLINDFPPISRCEVQNSFLSVFSARSAVKESEEAAKRLNSGPIHAILKGANNISSRGMDENSVHRRAGSTRCLVSMRVQHP
jgi:hypothetical protein